MLVLLGMSVLAAALVPPPPVNDQEREETTVTEPPTAADARGELVTAKIDAGAVEQKTIRARVGDQLALTVRAREADQVEIPELGELEFAAPLAPARFDILTWEEATYAVRLVDADRVIGRIVVDPRDEGEGEDRRLTDAPNGNQ